jgi:DNA (cytosine-5)-methyltransferase 1
MSKKTFTALFAGGGGADLGAIAAGLEPCESVEYDPAIAEVHKANIGGKMHVKNILDCDPYRFERPDILHASPVCKSYSTANPNKGEKALDVLCARKVAEFIQVLRPQTFTLENVQAYATAKDNTAFNIILEMLYSQGYWVNYQVLNAADFGVPQSRRRLILIAVKDGFIPSLPLPEKHIGWYEAIKDKVHDLPDSQLADWQYRALPNNIREHCFYIYGSQNINFGGMIQPQNKPANTLLADCCSENGIRSYKAILVENTGARSDRELQTREATEPCWTLRAMGQDGHYHRANALLNARIVALDIACLARLQSFPDNYQWSGKKSLDGKIIGNSVPPLMYQKILQSIIQ